MRGWGLGVWGLAVLVHRAREERKALKEGADDDGDDEDWWEERDGSRSRSSSGSPANQ